MTPKKAAAILLYSFLAGWYAHPRFRTNEELSEYLDWNVTDKRREAIMAQIDKIGQPFMNRLEKLIDDDNFYGSELIGTAGRNS